ILAATYLGGSSEEWVAALALDGQGQVYVAGQTNSPDFPGVGPQSADASNDDYVDGFVAKLDGGLTTILAATFLGGTCYDVISTLAVDGQGRVSVGGVTSTYCNDFPGLGPRMLFALTYDMGFLAQLNTDLTTVLAGTLLGNSINQNPTFTLDSQGQIYVTGLNDDGGNVFFAKVHLDDFQPLPPTLGLPLPLAGQMVIELLSPPASFGYTLAVASPLAPLGLGQSSCGVAPATGLPGTPVLSGQVSQPGCRVLLDPNPASPGSEAFAPGVTL